MPPDQRGKALVENVADYAMYKPIRRLPILQAYKFSPWIVYGMFSNPYEVMDEYVKQIQIVTLV